MTSARRGPPGPRRLDGTRGCERAVELRELAGTLAAEIAPAVATRPT
jgi:hypothetical protein